MKRRSFFKFFAAAPVAAVALRVADTQAVHAPLVGPGSITGMTDPLHTHLHTEPSHVHCRGHWETVAVDSHGHYAGHGPWPYATLAARWVCMCHAHTHVTGFITR